jgi:hypothetical protein
MHTLKLTSNLLKAFAVQLAHGFVLLAQKCNTPVKRESDAEVVTVELVLTIRPLIAQRRLHLLNFGDEALCFLCHIFSLPFNNISSPPIELFMDATH